ncbi:MAG: Ig-like domain repeat protein [Chloroflexi bacterium]|nr:Ig-like domain repeat protein [Chloroflexota bacterium]
MTKGMAAVRKLLVPILLLLLASAATLGTVMADAGHGGEEKQQGMGMPPEVEFQLPQEMAVGQEVALQVTLHGSGPLAGAQVLFLSPAQFAGTEGEVELGRAVTDAQGVASLSYVPRRDGETTITARFAGNDQYGAAEVSRAVQVQPGPSTYQQTAGVRVPGINVWLLVGVMGAVWATYFTVMIILGLIVRRGHIGPAASSPEVRHG